MEMESVGSLLCPSFSDGMYHKLWDANRVRLKLGISRRRISAPGSKLHVSLISIGRQITTRFSQKSKNTELLKFQLFTIQII